MTLLSLAILVATEFAAAQTGYAPSQITATHLSIPLFSPDQMTAEDRAAAQSWHPAIASSAQFFGYTVDSSYTYREIACPVAPQHLLLAYEATAPNGLVSRFTAVVRRGAEEETAGSHPVAQIIPILHFGVVPFIPAIANPHSIEVFNAAISPAPSAVELLSANQAGNQPLLVRALCFLAMVGEEPAALTSRPVDPPTIHAPVPTLVFQNKGKIRQQISIRSSQNSYQVWALTFQSGGNLLTATRQEHPIDRTPLVLNAANSASPPVSSGSPASAVQTQPQPPAPVATPIPPATATAIPVAPAEPAPPGAAPATHPARVSTEVAATPAPPTPPANSPAVEASTPVAPSAAAAPANATNIEPSQPASAPPPAEARAPITEPTTTPVSAPTATTIAPVEPVVPATPTSSPASAAAPTPPESAAVPTPQPPIPAPAVMSTPPPSAAAWAATPPPVVKLSPPLPPGRLIQNLPQPPSRIIPDSALKTPPHLPQ